MSGCSDILRFSGLPDEVVSLVRNGIEHIGDEGYFLFEASGDPKAKCITLLSKFCSFDAALQLVDLRHTRGH